MGSRLRATKQVFDRFLEIAPAREESGQPWVLQTFPTTANRDKEADKLKNVSQFAFPCKVTVDTVQHFSFVLTNEDAKWTFGFCRLAPNCETALVFLSGLPWHELFYKMLNQCAELIQSSDSAGLDRFLEAAHRSPLPGPGLIYHVEYGAGRIFTSPTPNPMNLPSVPENRNLTEYINAVDTHNMMVMFASMLFERRILVVSKKLSRLSACVQAANAIIYPMFWQHIFIPVLPAQLMDYLCAPMPFLIGVPEPIMRRVRHSELGEVVILDADNNRVDSPFPDLESLPPEVVNNLKKSLKSPGQMLGDSVARAFLQALVHLIGGYRDGLRYRSGGKITFNEEAFVRSRPPNIQPFLEKMLQLQIFHQFIDERLNLLNSGRGFSDEFELESVAFTDRSNKRLKNQYTAMTQNVRKESGAFVKAVKSKANPAVKDAVKTVKEGSKIAQHKAKATYKDLKSRLRENREEIRNEDLANSGDSIRGGGGGNTHSAPSSPVQSRSSSALGRYGTMTNNQFPRQNTDLSFGRVRKYERFDPTAKELSPDFEDLPRLEYDLMSDLEEVMSRGKAESGLSLRNGAPAQQPQTLPPANSGVPGLALSNHGTAGAFGPPPLPGRLPAKEANPNSSRKPSVGDLINLEAEEDTELEVSFDPLASGGPAGPAHRKLSRTGGNPFLATSAASSIAAGANPMLPQYGKYENYTPPAGNSHAQFKEFLSSMTDPARPATNNNGSGEAAAIRSSDDLLSEYGLHFSGLGLQSRPPCRPTDVTSLPSTRGPSFSASSSHANGAFSSASLNPRSMFSSAVPSVVPLPPPRAGPPPAPGRPTNSSFLYSSSQPFVLGSDFSSSSEPVGTMPVNQRIRSLPGEGKGPILSGDIFADLDPLRIAPTVIPNQKLEVKLAGIKPPAVPPRVKKGQWTTFE